MHNLPFQTVVNKLPKSFPYFMESLLMNDNGIDDSFVDSGMRLRGQARI